MPSATTKSPHAKPDLSAIRAELERLEANPTVVELVDELRVGGSNESQYVTLTRQKRQEYLDRLPQFHKDRVNGVTTKDHIPNYTLKKDDIGK